MTYRVYFNKRDPAGCMWSIDEGTQASEIHVQGFAFLGGVSAHSRTNVTAVLPEPSGFIEVMGTLKLAGGFANFYPLGSSND